MAPTPGKTSAVKRKADDHDPSISPPPTRRKIQNSVSKQVMASFFTPASQKPKDSIVWTEHAPATGTPATLLVARYELKEGGVVGGGGGFLRGRDEKNKTKENCPESKGTPRAQRIAAFDLDSTLITTASGKKHAESEGDWKWWHPSVPQRLRELHEQGYRIAIFSNQGGLRLHPDENDNGKPKPKAPKPKTKLTPDRLTMFRNKCRAVLEELALPVTLYAATGKDIFRKPRRGMWDLEVAAAATTAATKAEVNYSNITTATTPSSFFVGDAAGRPARLLPSGGTNTTAKSVTIPRDFSCSDRNLAHNAGIPFFTPEEFFLGEPPQLFERAFDLAEHSCQEDDRDDGNGDQELSSLLSLGWKISHKLPTSSSQRGPIDMVLFCGPPAAGKSSFFRRHLEPLGYARVNQDTLKTKEKCIKVARQHLQQGTSVVIDNTNPDPATRALWVDLAKKHDVDIRCLWFKTPLAVCEHNDTVRALNKELNPDGRESLPRIAFNGFNARFKEPKETEGFSQIIQVPFRFRGTKEEYAIWAQYWL